MRLIDGDALYERTAEWEAQALHMVEVTMNDENKTEWRKWSAVLAERSAFKHDIADAITIEPERKKGRWIPCSERLPEKPNMYTVTDSKGDVVRFVFYNTESSREYWLRCAKAWMPLPEPYREEGGE